MEPEIEFVIKCFYSSVWLKDHLFSNKLLDISREMIDLLDN